MLGFTIAHDKIVAIDVLADPERLSQIEERLATIDRLKRKYGQTLDEVIAFGEETARKLKLYHALREMDDAGLHCGALVLEVELEDFVHAGKDQHYAAGAG